MNLIRCVSCLCSHCTGCYCSLNILITIKFHITCKRPFSPQKEIQNNKCHQLLHGDHMQYPTPPPSPFSIPPFLSLSLLNLIPPLCAVPLDPVTSPPQMMDSCSGCNLCLSVCIIIIIELSWMTASADRGLLPAHNS